MSGNSAVTRGRLPSRLALAAVLGCLLLPAAHAAAGHAGDALALLPHEFLMLTFVLLAACLLLALALLILVWTLRRQVAALARRLEALEQRLAGPAGPRP